MALPAAHSRFRLAAAAMFVVTFLAHARSIPYPFSDFDDFGFVLQVEGYRGLAPDNIAWDFSHFNLGHYQPLTYLSYGLDYALWGLSAPAMHTTNILLHAINAVLVLWLAAIIFAKAGAASEKTSTLLAAAAAALFFGLHPLRVESVAWITERRDVLSGLFLFLTAIFYLRAHTPGETTIARPRLYWLAVALLLLSLLSKAWGMTFFVVAMVLDVYPLRRLSPIPWQWRAPALRVLAEKIPFAILGLVFAVVASLAQSHDTGTVKTLAEWGVVERLVQASYGLFFYLEKTLIPTGLAALYELPLSINPAEPRFIAAYIALALLTVALFVARRRTGLLAAVVCYLIVVSPVLGLFQSGIQIVADRYSYLACVPWVIAAGWLCGQLFDSSHSASRRRGVIAGVALVSGLLIAATWQQTGFWSTTEATFRRALDTGSDGPLVRRYLGKQIEQRGDRAGALAQYDISVKLDPAAGESWLAIGNVQRDAGNLTASAAAYRRAIETLRNPWEAYVGLGLIAMRTENLPDAAAAFRAAITQVERADQPPQLPGGGGLPYLLLAGVLDMSGDRAGSRDMLRRAAAYPRVREQALALLADMDAEDRGR